MFSVFISYLLSFFIIFIQIFFITGFLVVFGPNLHILNNLAIAVLMYVISFTYIIPSIVISRFNLQKVSREERPRLYKKVSSFLFYRSRPTPQIYQGKDAPFFLQGTLLGSHFLILNSSLLERLTDVEMDRYLEAEMGFADTFNSKILGHLLAVLLFWRNIFNWLFNLLRAEAVFRYIFVVPRRLFNYISNSYKKQFFSNNENSQIDIRGIAQKVIYLENSRINKVHFNISSTTMWSLHYHKEHEMDQRFYQSELL